MFLGSIGPLVDGFDIAGSTIRGGPDSGAGAVSNEIADGTVTAADLNVASVRSAVLGPDSVGATQIQGGTVNSSKLSPNASSKANSSVGSISNGAPPAILGGVNLILSDPDSVTHRVLVTGYLNLRCDANCTPGGTISYQGHITDGTTSAPIGWQAWASIGPDQYVTLPVSVLDVRDSSAGPGNAWTYSVQTQATNIGTGTVTMQSVPLTVVDLGRGSYY